MSTFRERYPRLGPLLWIAAIQYFLVQLLVARDWVPAYSITHNTISDLGNTACGTYVSSYVCSPLHGLMNVSFIVLGACMALGALLISTLYKKTLASLVGFSCLVAAGIGTILVGIFPENTISGAHILGAALAFLIGNIGLVVLGFGLSMLKPLRIYTLASGIIALLALVFFVTHTYLGIGEGGMERISAYPQTLWLIAFGIHVITYQRPRPIDALSSK